MKYIKFKNDKDFEFIVTFPREINHNDIAEGIGRMRTRISGGSWRRFHPRPVSAGFIEGNSCVGRSETLRLDSKPEEDTKLYRKQF